MNAYNHTPTPRIYVASLADYNAGRLHGRWIDTDQGADELHAEIQAMLSESTYPPEENDWAIHDQEGFGGLALNEAESMEDLSRLSLLIAEHSELFADVAAYLGGATWIDEAEGWFVDRYHGAFSSVLEYTWQFIEDCYAEQLDQMGDFLGRYIDYEAIARDLELGGDIITFKRDGEIHIFSS
ncbi:MAG: antirestriction protein ArdA, partial [Planctomycetota bacterium]